MTAEDKLRELLATRPEMPTTDDLFRWWDTSGELLAELLKPQAPATPLDELADNLVADLHAMKQRGPSGFDEITLFSRIMDKLHALAVVHADTRHKVIVLERRSTAERTARRG